MYRQTVCRDFLLCAADEPSCQQHSLNVAFALDRNGSPWSAGSLENQMRFCGELRVLHTSFG